MTVPCGTHLRCGVLLCSLVIIATGCGDTAEVTLPSAVNHASVEGERRGEVTPNWGTQPVPADAGLQGDDALNREDRTGDEVSTEPEPVASDGDLDGVPDVDDNCPEDANEAQCDGDADGVGDLCAPQDGSWGAPILIPTCPTLSDYATTGDTCGAISQEVHSYPPAEQAQVGGEVVYMVVLDGLTEVRAALASPEPAGVDVDVHILASVAPLILVDRGHYEASAILEAGTYFIVVDTYGSDNTGCGSYALNVTLTHRAHGTLADPVLVGGLPDGALELPCWYEDTRDTAEAYSDALDSYPPDTLDQSGGEVIYRFTVEEEVRVAAVLRTPEPDGVDVDLHLLSDLEGPTLIERGDRSVYAILQPGTYYLVVDTYVGADGVALSGAYTFSLSVRRRGQSHPVHFNPYILAAVDYLYANYGLLGYDSAALTHDLAYGDYGTIYRSGGAKTMCVAGMLEVIVQAMTLYAEDTGDWSVFDYLPLSSWKSLHSQNIKAHIWVNHALGTWGTPDALVNFEMGEILPFEDLQPGAFLNLNRVSGTGHAVVFVAFIDANGDEYAAHHEGVVGFKYFSAQGGFDVGAGGLDYRYGVFDNYGKPEMPYKRDSGIIQTDNQHYLNTGAMLMPEYWGDVAGLPDWSAAEDSDFNADFFDGDTGEDDGDYTPRSPRWRAP
ncbi:MAG: thrombospondin type 3 repeat-containing protein [Myxococcota bacterium]